jgi:hypothetical protein
VTLLLSRCLGRIQAAEMPAPFIECDERWLQRLSLEPKFRTAL